jgi:membrane fusion protein (multidrug efflux system)
MRTISMHRSGGQKECWIPMINTKPSRLTCLLAVSSLMLLPSCQKKVADKTTAITRVVRVEPVNRADLRDWLTLSGDVVGELEVDVFPELPERIAAVNVAMGDYVKEGQVLFTLRKGTLRDSVVQSQATLQTARVRLKAAEDDLDRTQRLYKAGIATNAQLSQLQSLVDASRAQLVQLESMVNQTKTVERKSVIVAPISGFVGKVTADPGDMAMPQTALCSIAQFKRVKVTATAPDVDFERLKIGLLAEVSSDTMPGLAMQGQLSRISPMIDRQARSVNVEALFENPDARLRPGMLVDLKVLLAEYPQILVVKNQALINRRQDGRADVFVVENGRAKARAVKVGFREGERVQVLEGLRENDQVVVVGQNVLKDTDAVTVDSVVADSRTSENAITSASARP